MKPDEHVALADRLKRAESLLTKLKSLRKVAAGIAKPVAGRELTVSVETNEGTFSHKLFLGHDSLIEKAVLETLSALEKEYAEL